MCWLEQRRAVRRVRSRRATDITYVHVDRSTQNVLPLESVSQGFGLIRAILLLKQYGVTTEQWRSTGPGDLAEII